VQISVIICLFTKIVDCVCQLMSHCRPYSSRPTHY